jgi:hypothetical protein
MAILAVIGERTSRCRGRSTGPAAVRPGDLSVTSTQQGRHFSPLFKSRSSAPSGIRTDPGLPQRQPETHPKARAALSCCRSPPPCLDRDLQPGLRRACRLPWRRSDLCPARSTPGTARAYPQRMTAADRPPPSEITHADMPYGRPPRTPARREVGGIASRPDFCPESDHVLRSAVELDSQNSFSRSDAGPYCRVAAVVRRPSARTNPSTASSIAYVP